MLPLSNRLYLGMIGILLATLQLTGCQTSPPAAKAKLTPGQIAVLQEQGFKLAEEGWELSFAEKLLFGVDAYKLTEKSSVAVEKIGKALHSADIENLKVDGHTDSSGSDVYNRKLSLLRATAVADSLVNVGLKRTNIVISGLGKAHPVADNSTPDGRAENRRVVIIVLVP
ncbi:OmpA family protein [Glaciimonas sp. PCH181]|uniref:OmpA family protein n=1 Tax=Glaciimonas sp. PCH181 TaxID=2133943 RepID=UPI000D39947D|nr:OmpA family protein [Glaciimonas sp. PCH181]PUA17109.1 hypothetical protein C7W93_14250 [Glaciimonas sp. PCH181]